MIERRFRRWRVVAAIAVAAGLAGCAAGPAPRPRERGPLAHYQMARMYFGQGKIPEALEEIDRSLELDDSLPQVHFYKGFIFWSLERWEEAARSFERAVAIHPYYTDARMYLATCYENLGRPDDALAELDEALHDRTYPYPEKIHLNKGLILFRQGRSGEALRELRRAVEIRPKYHRAHYEMAKVLESMGRGEEALEAFAAAAPGYEEDPGFHYRYGAALFRAERREEAAKELRRAIELAPGSETAAKARDLLEVIG